MHVLIVNCGESNHPLKFLTSENTRVSFCTLETKHYLLSERFDAVVFSQSVSEEDMKWFDKFIYKGERCEWN